MEKLDVAELQTLIKAFEKKSIKQTAPQLCRHSAEQIAGNTEFRI